MRRRELIALGLGGLTTALGWHYRSAWRPGNPSGAGAHSVEQNQPFHFVAMGDVGDGSSAQYAVAQALAQHRQTHPFACVLLTGDNIYENGEIEKIQSVFERPYAALLQQNVKFYATLGNHDVRTHQGEDEIRYPGFNMASRYYTFTQQTVQFFALDTNQAIAPKQASAWATQLQWLRTELQRAQTPWKVVFAHHPVYSSGGHGSTPVLIRDLSPLFAEFGVQLYINGHDHNYERTVSLAGTTYITAGNGARLRSVGHSNWTAHASSQLGFSAFTVYSDRIMVQAIDAQNSVYDQTLIEYPVRG